MRFLPNSIRKVLGYLYWEKRWRHPINQCLIYLKGLFSRTKHHQTTFIVFAQGRTGSTILVDLINRSDQVHCDPEIFGASMPIRILFPKFYQRALANAASAPVYGYRIKIYDLTMFHGYSPEGAVEFMRAEFDKGAKIIYLSRSNKFRQAMSSLVAEARGTFHHKIGGPKQTQKVVVDAQSIPNRMEKLHAFTEWEQRALEGFEYLDIQYERDLLEASTHQTTLDRITSFLGVAPCVAESGYKRSSSDDLSKYVENYDEVLEVVTASGNAHFLEQTNTVE